MVGTLGVALFAWGLNLLALVTDIQAFKAIATPILVCWLVLCSVCATGVWLTVHARRRGVHVPLYFRALLVLGALAGVLTLSPAFRVLSKDAAEKQQQPAPAANKDMRNRTVKDVSFAGQDLQGSNFSDATLHHVDFSGADLSETDFRNATFEDVDLSGATLCGADIRGADLREARDLSSVTDWSYVFYDTSTRVPKSFAGMLGMLPGPVPDTGHDLLYMCSDDLVRRMHG